MWKDSLSQNKAETDLRLVAEEILGQPARRSQRYIQYHAPSRRDSSPSLTVWADGYKDFGSDDSGDLFGFLATYANLSFAEAMQFLEGHTTISSQSRRPTVSDRSRALPSRAWQSAVSDFLTHAQHTLWYTRAGDHARAYLESQGYLPTTIESRGLGLNLGWRRLEIPDEPEPIWVAPGILYPWRQSGTLYGVKIRLPYHRNDQPDDLARRLNLPPGPMKYMQIKGSCLSQTWYGDIINPALPLILVEGEKDRDNLAQIAADQFNVITLGSATGRIPDSLWPHLRQAAWIAIVLDNDTAGQSNAVRLADHLNSRLLDSPAFTVALPTADKDLTDWLLSGADLSSWLSNLQGSSTLPCGRGRIGDGVDHSEAPLTPPPLNRTSGNAADLVYGRNILRPSENGHVELQTHIPPHHMERESGGEVDSTPLSTQWGGAGGGDYRFFPNGLPDVLREILLGLHQLTPQGRAYIADHSAAALILELITDAYRNNHLSDTDHDAATFTIQRLAEISISLNRHTSAKTIRRGLDQLVALHLIELIPFSTPSKPASNFILDAEKGNNVLRGLSPLSTEWGGAGGGDENFPPIPTTRGRPAQKYRPCDLRYALPKFLEILANRLRESLFAATTPDTVTPAWFESATTDETARMEWADAIAAATTDLDQAYADTRAKIEEELDLRLYAWSLRLNWKALSTSASTPIPADLPFASGRAYRDAYYQAKVAAAGSNGRQISRAKAAAEIGVNSRTLTRVRERVGIVTEAQYKEFVLLHPENILEQADLLAPWAAYRTFGRYLKSSSGARIALHPENRFADQWASTQMAQGHAVTLQIQIASREHLATPDLARQQRHSRLEKYRARCAQPSHFRTALRHTMPNHESPLSTQWGGVGDENSPSLSRDSNIGFVGTQHVASVLENPNGEVESSPFPNALERGRGWGQSPLSIHGAGDFSLTYIRDQLALRLPYLTATLQSNPTLRTAIWWIMGGRIARPTPPFSL
ncbi:MAG: hypothetical protein BroJett018_49250 [Chloroflexota bacterium]|nr:MAG: hypothetical protein BroJett018_49250 [Chloroflexota bacterium]